MSHAADGKTAIRDCLIVRDIGRSQYIEAWQRMVDFTDARVPSTVDEVWLTEHAPVFTLGQAGRVEHVLDPQSIPVVRTDRGGQVTYHGPGQLVGYLLGDLKRRHLGVHQFVRNLEQAMIQTLEEMGIDAHRIRGAPGVYVDGRKIGALGLRVRRGCSYHGISLNVAMDLDPYAQINPCGMSGMQMAQIRDYVQDVDMDRVKSYFVDELAGVFGYRSVL